MSAASVVRSFANQADATATAHERRDFRVAARELHQLADRLEKKTVAARERARRYLGIPEDAYRTPATAAEAAEPNGGSWYASKRTPASVTLRKVGEE